MSYVVAPTEDIVVRPRRKGSRRAVNTVEVANGDHFVPRHREAIADADKVASPAFNLTPHHQLPANDAAA